MKTECIVMGTSSIPHPLTAILSPTPRQVNAKGYSGKFRRRRREWNRGFPSRLRQAWSRRLG